MSVPSLSHTLSPLTCASCSMRSCAALRAKALCCFLSAFFCSKAGGRHLSEASSDGGGRAYLGIGELGAAVALAAPHVGRVLGLATGRQGHRDVHARVGLEKRGAGCVRITQHKVLCIGTVTEGRLQLSHTTTHSSLEPNVCCTMVGGIGWARARR